MTERLSKLTKEDLEKQVYLPEYYKKAIEHAIYEMALPDDPADAEWPDYFRAEVLSMEKDCELLDEDKIDDHFYVTEAGWFQAGWKARHEGSKSNEN